MRIKDCPECLEFLYSSPYLVEACASVGISRNKSTKEMILIFISGYHQDGHRESDRGLDCETPG